MTDPIKSLEAMCNSLGDIEQRQNKSHGRCSERRLFSGRDRDRDQCDYEQSSYEKSMNSSQSALDRRSTSIEAKDGSPHSSNYHSRNVVHRIPPIQCKRGQRRTRMSLAQHQNNAQVC